MSVGLNKVLVLGDAGAGFAGLGSNWEMEKKTVSRSNFFKKLGCELAKVAAAKTREDVD